MISLAETAIESRNIRDDTQSQILHLFQEGLELLQRCLGIQEIQLKKAEEQSHASQDIGQLADNEDANMIDRPEAVESVEDNWASIVEPVTTDTIVDNIVAQLETLTAICSLLGTQGHSVPDWVEQCYNNIHQAKVVDHSENGNEVALAAVKFKCAFFDTRFRSGNLDIQVYERELSNAFQQDLDILNNPQGLCDRADAELALNASLQASTNGSQQSPLPDFARLNNTRWKHITKALDCLTTASKLPQTQNLSRIQLRRGDCELLRLRLGQAPYYYDLAVQSTSSLTRNAEIYYRAAAAVAKMEDTSDEEREASIKEAIVMSLTKSAQQFKSLLAVSQTAIRETVEEMEEEGLLSGEAIDSINGLVAGE